MIKVKMIQVYNFFPLDQELEERVDIELHKLYSSGKKVEVLKIDTNISCNAKNGFVTMTYKEG